MLSSPPPFSFCRLGSSETRPTATDDGGDRRVQQRSSTQVCQRHARLVVGAPSGGGSTCDSQGQREE
ncbi:hypothetical protein ES332_A11G300700v1 [Gossypium tomentosum]|uniref:Uncharacterized protein n=1 Tax=Gossypium tomentosum TaxID=34277 RepID=A0A5D2NFN0_GOSTO|nr:hypothetical protein ES332_A11G300700v1 [Gossypium tomentosum]